MLFPGCFACSEAKNHSEILNYECGISESTVYGT